MFKLELTLAKCKFLCGFMYTVLFFNKPATLSSTLIGQVHIYITT